MGKGGSGGAGGSGGRGGGMGGMGRGGMGGMGGIGRGVGLYSSSSTNHTVGGYYGVYESPLSYGVGASGAGWM